MYIESLKSLATEIFTKSGMVLRVLEDPKNKDFIKKHTKDVLMTALSSRSPFIQEISKSISELLKEKEQRSASVSDLLKKNKDFAAAASTALGTNNTKELEKTLSSIFMSLEKTNNTESEQYKLFGTLFQEYKKNSDKMFSALKESASSTASSDSVLTEKSSTALERESNTTKSSEVLTKIENNTDLTVKKLSELVVSKESVPQNKKEGGTAPSSPKQEKPSTPSKEKEPEKILSFKEQLLKDLRTSVKETLKQGNILTPAGIRDTIKSVVFSASSTLVNSVESKAKEVLASKVDTFFEDNSSSKIVSAIKTAKENISKFFSDDEKTSSSKNDTSFSKESIEPEQKKEGGTRYEINKSLSEKSSAENERETFKEEQKTEKHQNSLLEKMLEELKHSTSISKTILKTGGASGALGALKDAVLSRGGALLAGAGGLLGTAAGAILSRGRGGITGALRTAGSLASYLPKIPGVGGFAEGAARAAPSVIPTVAKTSGGIATALRTGAAAVGGSVAIPILGALAAGTAGLAIGSKVINPLLEKGITAVSGKENSLGTFLADIFKSDSEKKLEADNKRFEMTSKKMESVKTVSNTSKQISDTLSRKEELVAKENKAQQQPVIIQQGSSGGGSGSSGGGGASQVIGTKTVRNTESTFERVQMQDFWSRSF